MEPDLKELLHRRADDVRIPPDLPPATLHRARRRRGWSATFAGMAAVTVIAGTITGVQFLSRSSNTPPIDTPTPPQTKEPTSAPPVADVRFAVPAVWPETSPSDIEAEQQVVDSGADPGRTNPLDTASSFAMDVLGWSEVSSVAVSSDDEAATMEVALLSRLPGASTTVSIRLQLAQLAHRGEGGIWSVVEVAPGRGFEFQAGPSSGERPCGPDRIVLARPAMLCGSTPAVARLTVRYALYQGERVDVGAIGDAPVRGEIPTDDDGRFEGGMTEHVVDDASVLFVRFVDQNGAVVSAATSRVRIAPTAAPTPAGTTPSTGGVEINPDAIDLALWPATSLVELDGLRQQIADGTASYALDPEETAVEFAVQVMGWRRDSVAITTLADAFLVRPADEAIGIWNTEHGGPRSSATSVYLVAAPGIDDRPAWLVSYVTSGLFELSCPSVQETTLDTIRPFEVCGTLMEPGTGWTATATVEYAESQLQPSEAASNLNLRIDGARFGGVLQLIATYPSDVSFAVRLLSSEGTLLGIDARRMTVTRERDPGSTVQLTDQVKDTRQAILDAARAGSYEQLRDLIGTGFTFSYGASGTGSTADRAFAFWQRDGVEPLRVMAALLEMPYTTVPTEEGLIYAWPALYDWTPDQLSRIDEVAPEWRGALEQIYPDFDRQLQSWIENGGYLGWRLGIAEDGRWMFFVAGD